MKSSTAETLLLILVTLLSQVSLFQWLTVSVLPATCSSKVAENLKRFQIADI